MPTVPSIPLCQIDDLATRIRDLVNDAQRSGYLTLAFFLDTALIEARIEQRRQQDHKVARQSDHPFNLWPPETC